jgi:hypothetical protein
MNICLRRRELIAALGGTAAGGVAAGDRPQLRPRSCWAQSRLKSCLAGRHHGGFHRNKHRGGTPSRTIVVSCAANVAGI